MSTGARVPLPVAREVARRLVAVLAPACERIEIAGSIRRGKADVGDIELVAIPLREGRVNILDQALDELIAQFKIQRRPVYASQKPAWGERYKKFWLIVNHKWGIMQVDLFLATPENWGAIFTIRTGPSDFSKDLVTHIRDHTPLRQDGGNLIYKAGGGIVIARDEESYFTAAGVPYIAPEKRTVQELRRVLVARPAGPGVDFSTPEVAGQAKHQPIMALSLWQPWASFIAAGLKQIETRGWPTNYRGLLAIHAAQRQPETFPLEYLTAAQRESLPDPLPRGAVVCIARLVDVIPTARLTTDPSFKGTQEFDLGDFSPGRWGWKLELVEVFEKPIPVAGQQGLWKWAMPERMGAGV